MIENIAFILKITDLKTIHALSIFLAGTIALLLLYNKRKDNIKIMMGKIVFDNLKNPMVITNNERKIVYVNSSFEELTGYRPEEILHKNTKFLHSGIHDKEFYTEMDSAINEYGRWQGEIWDRKKSGEIFPKHLTITAVERQDGKRINYVGIYQDPIEMKKIEENFVRLEKYDLLTGLPNDKYLREILTKEMSIKSTSHEEQFVISFKITNFNEIVASYGYRLMDEVMVNMINRVELIFSGIGTLFRTEKEVFMVYGTIDTQIQSLESIAEELNSAISIGFSCDDEIVFINIIIGILPIINTYDNVYRILEDVNLAIDWAAKSNNGNYAFYDESIREQLQNDVKIETLLRTAIDNMELSLLYQPQHDTKTGKIIGLEALVRWNNDEIGQVSPFIFIPIAERLGLIYQIGRWVMLEACKQNKKWQKLGLPKIPVSVNLSPIQFKNSRLVDDIKSILQECGLEGKYLGVEITENALVEDIKDINKKLSSLKDMGIKISIDDFGTGYSSLRYLRDLNLDVIKIDREFIKDYPEKDDGSITKIILNLARELGYKTVSEGVETQEQLDFVNLNGGDVIQGYFFSPPVSPERIEEILTKQNEG